MMSEIENLQPEEEREITEEERVEQRELDEATHEPQEQIEQRSFTEAEAIEESLSKLSTEENASLPIHLEVPEDMAVVSKSPSVVEDVEEYGGGVGGKVCAGGEPVGEASKSVNEDSSVENIDGTMAGKVCAGGAEEIEGSE